MAYSFTNIDFPVTNSTRTVTAVNNVGQVVGFYYDSSTPGRSYGFLYDAGNYTVLDRPGWPMTRLSGINDAGQIVGTSYDDSNRSAAFVYANGQYQDISIPGSQYVSAGDINNKGDIVGSYSIANSGAFGGFRARGFVISQGVVTTVDNPDPDFPNTTLSDINDFGQIIGRATDRWQLIAREFVYNNGQFRVITAPESVGSVAIRATGINNSGQIVGYYSNHGFIDDAGTSVTFDVPGADHTIPNGINDAGQIVGDYGDFRLNNGRGFLTSDILFDGLNNDVNFNQLSNSQAASVLNKSNLYDALAGGDIIVLPTDARAVDLVPGSSTPVVFDFTRTFHGGEGADTFDFTKAGGLSGYAAGRTLFIDGDANAPDANPGKPFATPSLVDKLILPGSPSDYTFSVTFGPAQSTTHTVVSQIVPVPSAAPPVSIDTVLVERVVFAAPDVTNAVSGLDQQSVYAEIARLSSEVYDARAGESAVFRGWHAVSALELGLLPASFFHHGTLTYSFSNGLYQATDKTGLPLAWPTTEAHALVLSGVANGMRTLTVVFRGTDSVSDLGDYPSFNTDHYAKFAPLVDALKSYVASSDFDQILIGGHSLGGGVAQLFANDIRGLGSPVKLFTFGSPGAEEAASVPQINFLHTQDPVATVLSQATQPLAASVSAERLLATAFLARTVGPVQAVVLLNQIQPKSRSGTDVALNSDISSVFLTGSEHSIGNVGPSGPTEPGYVRDIQKLVAHAKDPISPFSKSDLGRAITQDAVFTGVAGQIAIGNSSAAGGTMHVDRKDRYVLGDIGKDDAIRWNGSSAVNKDIDGGGGSQSDALVLTSGTWSWTRSGDHYDLYKAGLLSGNSYQGTFRRISLVIAPGKTTITNSSAAAQASTFGASPQGGATAVTIAATAALDPASLVTHLDGTPTTVQQAALGSTTLAADGTSDVTYAGTGVTELQSSAARAVLLYGADTARVTVTGGEATVVSDGTSGAAVTIDTGNTPSVVVGGARAQVIIGHLAGATFQGGSGDSTVAYAGARSAYTLTTEADGSTTVSDTAGTGGDRLAGIQRVAFADQTVEITATLVPDPEPHFVMADVTANISSSTIGEPNNGPVDYLQNLFLYEGSNSVAIVAQTDNVFIKSGSGIDALQARGGRNVLDGGTGSNFLVGATGADGGTDTFFTDARGSDVVWNTLANFHAGDAATLWGFLPGVSTWGWDGISGADGYQGATLRADVHGTGTKDASITFAGLSMEQAQGLLVASGTAGENPYLYLYNPGV